MKPPRKSRVLFVCIHNSARSQMAEAFLNHLGGEWFQAESAGLEPGRLNPVVVEAMREIGIDISANPTKSVESLLLSGCCPDVVVTVCDEASADRCPVFPGVRGRMHWTFADPGALVGTSHEKLAATRVVRDAIQARIETWVGAHEAAAVAAFVPRPVEKRTEAIEPVRSDSISVPARPLV